MLKMKLMLSKMVAINKPTPKVVDELMMPETSQPHPRQPRALSTHQFFKDQVEKKEANQV